MSRARSKRLTILRMPTLPARWSNKRRHSSRPAKSIFPDRVNEHWLTFSASGVWANIYSEQGTRFRRKYPEWSRLLESALIPRRRSAEENRQALEGVVA